MLDPKGRYKCSLWHHKGPKSFNTHSVKKLGKTKKQRIDFSHFLRKWLTGKRPFDIDEGNFGIWAFLAESKLVKLLPVMLLTKQQQHFPHPCLSATPRGKNYIYKLIYKYIKPAVLRDKVWIISAGPGQGRTCMLREYQRFPLGALKVPSADHDELHLAPARILQAFPTSQRFDSCL